MLRRYPVHHNSQPNFPECPRHKISANVGKFRMYAYVELIFINVLCEFDRWWGKPVIQDMVQTVRSISHSSTPSEALSLLRESGSPLLTVVDDKG